MTCATFSENNNHSSDLEANVSFDIVSSIYYT